MSISVTKPVTIAVSIKINDGIVLAADSAASIFVFDEKTRQGGVAKVYENAEKIFNLYKGLSVGVVTWGSGGIGQESITTLAKDFRKQVKNNAALDKDNYSVEHIATLYKEFIYTKYINAYQNIKPPNFPSIGFIVAGYSSNAILPEEYLIQINEKGLCEGPVLLRAKEVGGVNWQGIPDAIWRLVKGYSMFFPDLLLQMGVPKNDIDLILKECENKLEKPLIHIAMPIQDAIALAEFLVQLTINFVRFDMGPEVVCGPIDIAAITKHEGFKWIKRKHYFNSELNPGENI